MNVGTLMTRDVVSLDVSDHLDLAQDIMQLGRIRHMPVMDGDKLAGILSQRDLFRAAVSSVLSVRPSAQRDWLARVRVADVMTAPVVTVASVASVRTAVDLMLDKRIGCLVVVDDDRMVGLLSESDCLRHLSRVLEITRVTSEPPEGPPSDSSG